MFARQILPLRLAASRLSSRQLTATVTTSTSSRQSQTIETRVRRGDIVTVAGGAYATEPRPALVVQDDRFDAIDSLTVCPFTSTRIDAPLLRVPVTADEENGLDQDSFLMVDTVTPVRRSNVGIVSGKLEATMMVEFERRLLVVLGFGA